MIHVEHEHPYQAIIDIVEARACELVVMAPHGHHGIVAVISSGHTAFQICWSAKGQRLESDMIDLDQWPAWQIPYHFILKDLVEVA